MEDREAVRVLELASSNNGFVYESIGWCPFSPNGLDMIIDT